MTGIARRLDTFGVVALGLTALPILLLADATVAGETEKQPSLECKVGPISAVFGGANWLVYSCNDGKSLVVITPKDNPAAPFVFFILAGTEGYSLRGEGNGNKTASAAAFEDLKALTTEEIAALVESTRQK